MNHSNFSPNWEHLTQCYEEMEVLENYANERQLKAIYSLRNRAARCDNMKKKLSTEDKMLKAELLNLFLEKELYSKILRNICQLGGKLDWEP
jgi:glycyl-tRNA synthetase beta subunit